MESYFVTEISLSVMVIALFVLYLGELMNLQYLKCLVQMKSIYLVIHLFIRLPSIYRLPAMYLVLCEVLGIQRLRD